MSFTKMVLALVLVVGAFSAGKLVQGSDEAPPTTAVVQPSHRTTPRPAVVQDPAPTTADGPGTRLIAMLKEGAKAGNTDCIATLIDMARDGIREAAKFLKSIGINVPA